MFNYIIPLILIISNIYYNVNFYRKNVTLTFTLHIKRCNAIFKNAIKRRHTRQNKKRRYLRVDVTISIYICPFHRRKQTSIPIEKTRNGGAFTRTSTVVSTRTTVFASDNKNRRDLTEEKRIVSFASTSDHLTVRPIGSPTRLR